MLHVFIWRVHEACVDWEEGRLVTVLGEIDCWFKHVPTQTKMDELIDQQWPGRFAAQVKLKRHSRQEVQ